MVNPVHIRGHDKSAQMAVPTHGDFEIAVVKH